MGLDYQRNSFNLAPSGLDYQTIPKFCSQPSGNVHLLVTFVESQKDLTFSIIMGPVMGFLLEHIAVKHVNNTLSTSANLGRFSNSRLKRPFTLSLDAT